MADYYLTAIWNNDKRITHALIHEVDENTVFGGSSKTEAEIIHLIEKGHSVSTARWNYQSSTWSVGARVEVVRDSNVKYLRSHRDATASDNLLHMLPAANLDIR